MALDLLLPSVAASIRQEQVSTVEERHLLPGKKKEAFLRPEGQGQPHRMKLRSESSSLQLRGSKRCGHRGCGRRAVRGRSWVGAEEDHPRRPAASGGAASAGRAPRVPSADLDTPGRRPALPRPAAHAPQKAAAAHGAACEARQLICLHRSGARPPAAFPFLPTALSYRFLGVRGVGRRAEGC